MKERTICFSGKSINVYFTVDRCTHTAECVLGAPKVFNPAKHPWIKPDGEDPDKVAEVVMRCPTGALHFKRKDKGASESILPINQIMICKNGPYYVKGNVEIINFDDTLIVKDTRIALCRCGQSLIKPLCDESHNQIKFHDRKPFPPGKISEMDFTSKLVIILKKDGPLQLEGPVKIYTPEGNLIFNGKKTALCRCGQSDRMVFCDGSHRKIEFTTNEKVILFRTKLEKNPKNR